MRHMVHDDPRPRSRALRFHLAAVRLAEFMVRCEDRELRRRASFKLWRCLSTMQIG